MVSPRFQRLRWQVGGAASSTCCVLMQPIFAVATRVAAVGSSSSVRVDQFLEACLAHRTDQTSAY